MAPPGATPPGATPRETAQPTGAGSTSSGQGAEAEGRAEPVSYPAEPVSYPAEPAEPAGLTKPIRAAEPEWFDRPDPTGRTDTGEHGLRFGCTMCGHCCTGAPGFVLFTPAEGKRMARRLGVSLAVFLDRYTHDTPEGRSLAEVRTAHGHDCVFLDRTSQPGRAVCGMYDQRPEQCRTWPFWKSNLRDLRAWRRAGQVCPGMNTGRLYPPELIRITRERVEI